MTKYILPIAAFALLISSCGTSNKYMADDIYVLKPSELAIGESSADETTYSSFKKRKQGDVAERQVYADQRFQARYAACLELMVWQPNCGCTYTQWINYSPYSYSAYYMNTRTMQPYFINGGGMYMFHNNYGLSPHMAMYGTGQYGYHGMYGNIYGMHNNFYGTGNFYNLGGYYGTGFMYNPYGYGFGGYGGYGYGGNSWWGNGSINSGSAGVSNSYTGPRGSSAGFANPRDRAYNGTLKSGSITAPKGTTATGSRAKMSHQSISGSREAQRKPIGEISRGVISPTTVDRSTTVRPTQTSGSGSRNYSVDRGVNPTATGTARPTQNRTVHPSTIQNSSPRNNTQINSGRTHERTSSPAINNSRPSGGNASGGSSSGGGARSGGSTSGGSTGGRR